MKISKINKWITEAQEMVGDNRSVVISTCLFCGNHRRSHRDKDCECRKKIGII